MDCGRIFQSIHVIDQLAFTGINQNPVCFTVDIFCLNIPGRLYDKIIDNNNKTEEWDTSYGLRELRSRTMCDVSTVQ